MIWQVAFTILVISVALDFVAGMVWQDDPWSRAADFAQVAKPLLAVIAAAATVVGIVAAIWWV